MRIRMTATLILTAAGLVAPTALAEATTQADDTTLGWIEISGALADAPGPFDWLNPDAHTFGDVLAAFEDAADDDSIDGVILRLKDAQLGMTQIEELGEAIEYVQAAGKKVHVFAEAYSTSEFLVASHADEALIQSGGAVSLTGMHMEEMYLADTLAWIGVTPQLVQVGAYKGANETMMRSEPSPEWDRNINHLLDGLYSNLRSALKQGRGLSDAQLDEAMNDLWMADADAAVEHGLLDAAIDLPTITDYFANAYDSSIEFDHDLVQAGSGGLDMSDPFAIFKILSREPDSGPDGPAIAVLHVNGAIIDGDSSAPGLFGGGGQVGSRTIRNAIEDILGEDDIEGVVVRIDSPGGSATASEVIWQGLRRLADEKPVWISVGSMAASGGYYTAVGGDKIYVSPSSIVGSIGVVGGKLTMSEVYDKVKLRVHSRSRGPRSAMFASNEAWSESELDVIREKMTEVYDLFTSRVTQGRDGIDLSKTAEGRLFTGHQAVALKMADAIGGLDDAVLDLAADLSMDDFEVVHYPAPKGLEEMFGEMFGGLSAPGGLTQGMAGSIAGSFPMLAAARELIGPAHWDAVAASLEATLRFRTSPVQLIMPRVLLFR